MAALRELPEEFTASQVLDAEAEILARCDEFDPLWLRRFARRAVAIIAPEISDAHDEKALRAAERAARQDRWFSWGNDGCGSVLFCGKLPVLDAEVVIDALSAITTPTARIPPLRPSSRCSTPPRSWSIRSPAGIAPKHLNPKHLDPLRPPAPSRPRRRPGRTALDALQQGHGRAELLTTSEPISVAETRRLTCQAGILPAVLGSDGQILDLGRARRLATGACRQALILRDGGCAFPGCEKPPRETEAHHIRPWWDREPTDLDNLVLLCSHHHRLVEPNRVDPAERTWSVTINPHDGIPEFTPPASLDAARTPIRHPRFHLALAG